MTRTSGELNTFGAALLSLSEIAAIDGEYARMESLLREAFHHFSDMGDQYRIARVYAMQAQLALARGDEQSVQELALQCFQIARSLGEAGLIIVCLAGLADSAARQHAFLWATRLWSVAEAQLETTNLQRVPAASPDREQLVAAARNALGEQRFVTTWQEAVQLTPEAALERPEASMSTVASFERAAPTRPAKLTRRELEVLRLISDGLTNGQIAERLVISAATVKTYLSTIYDKLGVRSRTAAMRYTIDRQL